MIDPKDFQLIRENYNAGINMFSMMPGFAGLDHVFTNDCQRPFHLSQRFV